jgi:hypothetical protein
MLGMEGAIDLLVGALELRMPAKIVELQSRYADADAVLPPPDQANLRPPALFASSVYQRLELAQYPAIEVSPANDGRPAWNSQGAGQFFFRVAYSMQILVTDRGNSYQQVDARRKRLTLAVKECLLATPLLQDSPVTAWVDTPTMRASYSPLAISSVKQADSRSIAATYIELDVIVEEMTDPLVPSGIADTIVATVHPSQLPA